MEDKNNVSLGAIYKSCLNDINYIENKYNNLDLDYKTNVNEMQGISNNINVLKQLKQDIVYMSPKFFSISKKIN